MRTDQLAKDCSRTFARIYYLCHPRYTLNLPHQAVRALQFINAEHAATVRALAAHLSVAHNTASELTSRLVDRALVEKRRAAHDERIVELSLTDEGVRALQEHTGLDELRLTEALDRMNERERDTVRRGLDVLEQHLAGTR